MADFKKVLLKADKKIEKLAELAEQSDVITTELCNKYKVFRGLRDLEGNGVVTGLTEVSEINAFREDKDGNKTPIEGELFYRGINIRDIVEGLIKEKRYGFEEVCYLLLCGMLPTEKELKDFKKLIADMRQIPDTFTRDVIMKAPSKDIMNALSKSILTLYSYDENPDDTSIKNVFRQCIMLIARMPMLAVYGYQAYKYYALGKNLAIRNPKNELSTAENILYMLNGTGKYTERQAHLLDICLILHMEHGGGNNSTFTTRVVTSSGTDTYSAISAALGSLKGPKHGGANIKVVQMVDDMMANVKDINDDEQVMEYLDKLLAKEAFDKQGLIYGLGHAVYSLSDPRADILHHFLRAKESEHLLNEEFKAYEQLYKLAPAAVARKRKIYKGVSVNIDFYTGYIYRMLKIPEELFTPIFAIARVVGWSSHRIEELVNQSKIIRPAYIAVGERQKYTPLVER